MYGQLEFSGRSRRTRTCGQQSSTRAGASKDVDVQDQIKMDRRAEELGGYAKGDVDSNDADLKKRFDPIVISGKFVEN